MRTTPAGRTVSHLQLRDNIYHARAKNDRGGDHRLFVDGRGGEYFHKRTAIDKTIKDVWERRSMPCSERVWRRQLADEVGYIE